MDYCTVRDSYVQSRVHITTTTYTTIDIDTPRLQTKKFGDLIMDLLNLIENADITIKDNYFSDVEHVRELVLE